MKNTWIGALALSLLSVLPCGAAETTLPPAAILENTVSEVRHTIAEAGMEAGAEFLPVLDLGEGVTYTPAERTSIVPDAVDFPMLSGQLRIERGGIVQTADVITLESLSAEMGSMFDGLFPEAGPVSPEGLRKITNFNRNLGNAQAMVNQLLVHTVARMRAETGEPMPYSLLYMEMRNVEAMHRLAEVNPLVYTTGGRILFYADGWIFPQYVKAYLWKAGPSYRVVILWTSDSQKEAVQEAGLRLVRAALSK